MPNWCRNGLIVEGDAPALAEFLSVACGFPADFVTNLVAAALGSIDDGGALHESLTEHICERFSLEGHIPCPAELRNMPSPPRDVDEDTLARLRATYGATDWYQWCLRHWGTKWDVHDVFAAAIAPERVHLLFSTAWALPGAWLDAVSLQHPGVRFTIGAQELGNNLSCIATLQAGEVLYDVAVPIPPDPGWHDEDEEPDALEELTADEAYLHEMLLYIVGYQDAPPVPPDGYADETVPFTAPPVAAPVR